ncbi:MAG: glycoside hydrolase family 13 protein [Armatimonadetes bacterium]|nr:glycoside hydrolase family 13 protein [Armatimonadota bacterium]
MIVPIVAMSLSKASIESRAKDWRNGAVVYQVFVDRFVPPANPRAKAKFYASPRTFHSWDDLPKAGKFDPKLGVWTHELDFWGGDLKGVESKLSYIRDLGADVLYLNPIHEAFTNHKYDAIDYKKVDPAFGTTKDLSGLISKSHKSGLKVVLDGVFNHMGRRSPYLQDALKSAKSPYRDWFFLGKQYQAGYKGWLGGVNMPVLHLEDAGLQKYLWRDKDSVVQHYLNLGIDGWRLDVAYEIGPELLGEITKYAHKAKKGSLVVGEILGYPAGWFPNIDGQYNLFAPGLCMEMLDGTVSGGRAADMLNDYVADAGIENVLKSWLVADNHDTPRLTSMLPSDKDRMLEWALLFTLPGCPNVYYGSELGMTGGGDPENRAPMRWDLVSPQNETLAWVKKLIGFRKSHPSLRYGDFQALRTEKLLAFTRTTGLLREDVIVVVNPTAKKVTETFAHRMGNLMSWEEMQDLVSGGKVLQKMGLMTVEAPPKSIQIFVPVVTRVNGFSPYDRIK